MPICSIRPELIPELMARWREGFDVVLARRRSRDADHRIRGMPSRGHYRLHNFLSETIVPEGVGDIRLLDRRVVEAVRRLSETHRFLKGIFAWVCFRTVIVEFAADLGPCRRADLRRGLLVSAIWIVAKTLIVGTDLPGWLPFVVHGDSPAGRRPADRHRRPRGICRPHLRRGEATPDLSGARALRLPCRRRIAE